MGIKLKYFFVFILISASVSAQKNFVVYYVSGDVKIVSGNSSSVATRGNILSKENLLQVRAGAACMLIAEKGTSLQVNNPGTYNYEKLRQMLASAGSNVTAKFFSYVYDNLFTGQKKDQLGITPVVFRGDVLMKDPGDYAILFAGEITLGWKPAGKIPVHVVVKDGTDKIIIDSFFKKATSMQAGIAKIIPGNVYRWKAEERDTHQPKEVYFHFMLASKNDRAKIESDLKLLQDKNLSPQLKDQVKQDIFLKWQQYYSSKPG